MSDHSSLRCPGGPRLQYHHTAGGELRVLPPCAAPKTRQRYFSLVVFMFCVENWQSCESEPMEALTPQTGQT